MAQILATHDPFLHSQAQLFVLPVSTDGNIVHPVVARCKTLFLDNYQRYYQSAMMGELLLGQVMLNPVAKQQTGLGVQTSNVAYIANLMLQKFVYHPVSERMLLTCLKALKPMVYQLMRYQGLRRLSFVASPLLMAKCVQAPNLTAQQIFDGWQLVFADVPKLTVLLHFSKEITLPQKTLENRSQTGYNTHLSANVVELVDTPS